MPKQDACLGPKTLMQLRVVNTESLFLLILPLQLFKKDRDKGVWRMKKQEKPLEMAVSGSHCFWTAIEKQP